MQLGETQGERAGLEILIFQACEGYEVELESLVEVAEVVAGIGVDVLAKPCGVV